MSEHTNRIRVCVRVRPALPREAKDEVIVSVSDKNTIIVRDVDHSTSAPITHSFSFDRCYSSTGLQCATDADQNAIMKELGCDLVMNALDGYNDTLFAYGQTGAGKTYSIVGGTGEEMGLLPRIIEHLFDRLLQNELHNKTRFCCEVSYVEIYNDQINDLLVPNVMVRGQEPLQILHHPKYGTFIPGLTECNVRSEAEVMQLMETGLKMRSIGATSMNNKSSRSHCIFMMSIVQNLENNTTLRAKVNLVDLAGSERQKDSQSNGVRFREGAMINTTLSTLALVIRTLANQATMSKDNEDKRHFVPFRNSKLTYLLQESLAGNSKTVMIAALSPVQQSARETISTLRFASSVKRITTTAIKNEKSNDAIVAELNSEIEYLKAVLGSSMTDQDEKKRLTVSRMNLEWLSQRFSQSQKEGLCHIQRRSSHLGAVVEFVPRLRSISHDWFLNGKLEYSIGHDDSDLTEASIGSGATCTIQLRGVGIISLMAMIRTIKDHDDYKVYITRLNENGRVLVNGRLIAINTETALSHGDRVIFGHAFACMLVLPGMEITNTNVNIDKVMSEVEMEPLPQFKVNCKRFIDEVITRFGEEKGQGFVCEVKKALPMIAEANDISDVVHKKNAIRFSVASGNDLFDETPLLLIRSHHMSGGPDIFWTMTQFEERLTYMREAYDASLEGTSTNDTLLDPWLDSSYSPLLELAARQSHEFKQLRLCAKQNNFSSKAVREVEDPLDSSCAYVQNDKQVLGNWKEECFQAVLDSKKLNEAVLEEKKLGNDGKEVLSNAELDKFNPDFAEMREKATAKYWKERCELAENEMAIALDRLLYERGQRSNKSERPEEFVPEPEAPATGLTDTPKLLKPAPPLPNILEALGQCDAALPHERAIFKHNIKPFTTSGGNAEIEQQKQDKDAEHTWANAIPTLLPGVRTTPPATNLEDGQALLSQSFPASPISRNFPGFTTPPPVHFLSSRIHAPLSLMLPNHVNAPPIPEHRDALQISPIIGQWSSRGKLTPCSEEHSHSHVEGTDRPDNAMKKLGTILPRKHHGALNELGDIVGLVKKDDWAQSPGVHGTYENYLSVIANPQTTTDGSVNRRTTNPKPFTTTQANAKVFACASATPAPVTVAAGSVSCATGQWNGVPHSTRVEPRITLTQSPLLSPVAPCSSRGSSGMRAWFAPQILNTKNDDKKAPKMTAPGTLAGPTQEASPEGAAPPTLKPMRKQVHFVEPIALWTSQPLLPRARTLPWNADALVRDIPESPLSARQIFVDANSMCASETSERPLVKTVSTRLIGSRTQIIAPIKMCSTRFSALSKIRLSPRTRSAVP